MSERIYTLELTAEELLALDPDESSTHPPASLVVRKVRELAAKAKADRERDDLAYRTPWSAKFGGEVWEVYRGNQFMFWTPSEREAKGVAAWRESLEAVREAYDYFEQRRSTIDYGPKSPIGCALRKAAAGVPEEG